MSKQMLSSELLLKIQNRYPQDSQVVGEGAQQVLMVTCDSLLEIMEFLKTHGDYQFNMLRNLTAVDYSDHLEVVYHLYSLPLRQNVTIKTRCSNQEPEIPSVTGIWPSANFQEREVYDLMGINFIGHPDLRRILLPEDFPDHPLRKYFKLGVSSSTGGN